ncbi:N-acetylmannosamine-6-phosphate 2-epimerase [Blautia wexlerae]|jgi:N-acylglucosamine-6-phosphate 2-epimerase|uniref:N-acetylmannosamine-6-phosphate 2-epimerase n=1 Tax=Blautia wexlerae TaxID=418240 RepID=UPI00156ECBFA|nr:N-acetylmannosamine-6-phosphate 2-epimerase [Blautia wexlerae]NSE03470.1 N-acetylmannosamine-6-phosphate 2-epimerase [Blautia wexlerae]NSF77048.1 N-acetylmannosamine-6-phosphate 2-epimerase [Blautia wexlerae]
MTKKEFLDAIHGQMIISCQAVEGEPLYVEEKSIMYLMARAAKQAGTPAIRTSSIRDVVAIKEETELPVIGLVKIQYPGYEEYITPTMKEVDDLTAAGADVVALDCTLRKRGDGTTVNEFIAQIKEKYPDIILMADISNYEEGINAWKCGVDIVGTTMSGYTAYTVSGTDEPDYELMERLARDTDIPVIGEGRIHYPEQAVRALQTGVWAIVVGGAITRPLEIALRFQKKIRESR